MMHLIISTCIIVTAYAFVSILCSLFTWCAFGWDYESEGIFDTITLVLYRIARFTLRKNNVPYQWSKL